MRIYPRLVVTNLVLRIDIDHSLRLAKDKINLLRATKHTECSNKADHFERNEIYLL